MRVRCSILTLMGAVLFVALGFAALRNPSVLWASGLFTATVLLLSAAILGAMARTGRARMTWAGFALFGWVYLSLTFGPWPNGNGVNVPPLPTVLLYEPVRRHMVSVGGTTFIRDTGERPERIDQPFHTRLVTQRAGATVNVPMATVLDLHQARRVLHSLGALLSGLIGMAVGGLVSRADESSTSPP